MHEIHAVVWSLPLQVFSADVWACKASKAPCISQLTCQNPHPRAVAERQCSRRLYTFAARAHRLLALCHSIVLLGGTTTEWNASQTRLPLDIEPLMRLRIQRLGHMQSVFSVRRFCFTDCLVSVCYRRTPLTLALSSIRFPTMCCYMFCCNT